MALTFQSPHIPAFIGDPIDSTAASIGIPADQLRMTLALLASIPLGLIHTLLPIGSPWLGHVYSLVLGIGYNYFLIGSGCLHLFISTAIVYVMCATLPRKSMPALVFTFSLVYLSASHIYRTYYDYLGWSLDFTMIQMIWCVKSVFIAYNWADGQALNAGERLHDKDGIHKYRAGRALLQFPSLLEFFSYSFFYAGLLVGPAFEMKDYLAFQDRSVFVAAGRKDGSVPFTLLPALLRVVFALISYVGIALGGFFPLGEFLISPEWNSYSFAYRFSYSYVAAILLRCKYYFAWYLAEAGCIACGLGFNGAVVDKATGSVSYKWDRCSNVNAIGVETGYSLPHLTNYWNLGVNNWLKNYVYFRVDPPKSLTRILPSKSFANIVTKFTSAFWHGFYLPYYTMFLTAWLVNEMDDARHAAFDRFFFNEVNGVKVSKSILHTIVYRVTGWLLIFTSMNQLGISFNMQRLDWSIEFWRSCYFIGFLSPIVVIIISKAFMPKREKKEKKADTATTALKSD